MVPNEVAAALGSAEPLNLPANFTKSKAAESETESANVSVQQP
jgi:hypothetical protein